MKQLLAAVRMLFDWLVIGQVVPMNPAAAVRGPKHVVKTGKTPVLDGAEWRKLIDSIPTGNVRDLRDRALIATLTYSFARIGAALKMKVEDLRPKGAGWQVQLHEKGGKQHVMPCHHALAEALRACIDAAGMAEDRKGWLFRASPGHNGTALKEQPMDQPAAWLMIRRRAAAAGIFAPIGNHTFRATGITAYLGNGGALEHAQSVGKSWLACALGFKACRENLSVLYQRVPRLFTLLALGRGDGRYAKLMRQLGRVDLLILDLCAACSDVELEIRNAAMMRVCWPPAPHNLSEAHSIQRGAQSRFSQSTMLTAAEVTWPARGGASISGNTCISAWRLRSRSALA